jgi:hypothetical protein
MLEVDAEGAGIELDARRISHHVEDVFFDEDDHMCVEVSFIDTALGRLVRLMPDMVEPSVVAIGFCGWSGESNVVVEAALIHFNLAWKKGGNARSDMGAVF